MSKTINIKLIKLVKYYNLINHTLIFNNKSINRYNKNILDNSSNKSKDLKILKTKIEQIKNCKLKENASKLVFSDGNQNAKIMIIGEGPGANEDKEGLPFVGRAGQLLDKMLNAINLNRNNVYITNVVNYRPAENRKPTDKEISRYLPYLKKHIEIIKPKVILLLGSTAMNAILKNEDVISNVRGKWFQIEMNKSKINLIVSFHPAYLLRQPDQKKFSWIDLKMIRDKIRYLKIKIEKY
jgi:DNA polymerase|tara:strand:- start:782 stop:1498 length:717 start_codon:yes stop_codon:yes gene_type:complete